MMRNYEQIESELMVRDRGDRTFGIYKIQKDNKLYKYLQTSISDLRKSTVLSTQINFCITEIRNMI